MPSYIRRITIALLEGAASFENIASDAIRELSDITESVGDAIIQSLPESKKEQDKQPDK